jgi:hypothetical protein
MEIRDAVLAEPHRLHMAHGIQHRKDCGTAGCIAGWACIIDAQARGKKTIKSIIKALGIAMITGTEFKWYGKDGIESKAAAILGMEEGEAENLFFFYEVGRHKYMDLSQKLREVSVGTPEYAAIVVEAIDRFLTSKGFDVPKLVAEYHRELVASMPSLEEIADLTMEKYGHKAAPLSRPKPQPVLEMVVEQQVERR